MEKTKKEITQTGLKIRKLRELRGYTQEFMSKKLKLSLNGYGKVEREETDITLERLNEIAQILEVNTFDLLGFDENKLVFNQTHTYNDASNSTNIAHQEVKSEFEGERKQYENRISDLHIRISSLEKEIERLHDLLKNTISTK
jgi:transcriptional regulator with XRE-family HTH domain